MTFIGIIGKESDFNYIKNDIIKKWKSSNKVNIVNINKESVQNLKNIRFETIIVNDDYENLLQISKYLEDIIKNAKYLIINSDIINNVINLSKTKIITYGLNYNANITISSIREEKFLICLQEPIEDINKNIIEQQEFIIDICKNDLNNIYNSMVISIILLIYGQILQKK